MQINHSQTGAVNKNKPKVINISNIHTLTKDLVDMNITTDEIKGPNKKPNLFKPKDNLPLIIDDRSSYYDSDRERDFYNPTAKDDFDLQQ